MRTTELEDSEPDTTATARVQQTGSETASVEFTGRRGPLFKLALKNAILTVLTLGIYRFWAKTWVRRYFWHNIRIRGEALEYTGLPSELLIGFLIALAILAPIFIAYEGVYFFLGEISEPVEIALNAVYGLTLLAFFQFAFYRMWRYRLSRTVWRGIHFGLDGSALKYVGISMAWLLMTLLTLGLAYPWFRVATWRFRTRNIRFGNSHFAFDGSGRHLIKSWLIALSIPFLIAVLGIGGIGLMNADLIAEGLKGFSDPIGDLNESVKIAVGTITIVFMIAGIAGAISYTWYRVKEAHYLIGATTFQNAGFSADLRAKTILIAFMMNGLCILGVIGLASLLLIFAPVIGIFIMIASVFLFVQIIPLVILFYQITRHVCAVFTIENPAAFDLAVQSAKQGPQHGEGFADALDVGAI
jgi:uncharacterized membrane protein YjgN (DUF898 family)